MRVLPFGADLGYWDYAPNNPAPVPLQDVLGGSQTISDLRRCMVLAGGSDILGNAAGATVEGRSLAVAFDLTASQVNVIVDSGAVITAPMRVSGCVIDAQQDVGTDAEIRQLNRIVTSFGTNLIGTQTLTDYGFTGVDWSKTVYIDQGATSSTSQARADSFVGWTVEPDGVGSQVIARSEDQHDATLYGSCYEFVGSGWSVHRRRMTGADLTWVASANPNDNLLHADFDMYANATGIPGGAIANPNWSTVFLSDSKKRWVTQPADNLVRRSRNILSWPVTQGDNGRARIWREAGSEYQSDLVFQITVVAHAGIVSAFESEIVGTAWGGDEHDGGARGFGVDFSGAADDEVLGRCQNVTSESAADFAETWQPSLVSNSGMNVYQLKNSPSDNYLVIGQLSDLSEIGVNAPVATGNWVSSVSAYDSSVLFTGSALASGAPTQVSIQSASGTNVFSTFVQSTSTSVRIQLAALGYTYQGPQSHLPFNKPLSVLITNGTETRNSTIVIPEPAAFRRFPIATSSAALLATAPDSMAAILHAEGFPSAAGDEFIVQTSISVNEFTVLDQPVEVGQIALVNRYSEDTGWARTLRWIAGASAASNLSVVHGVAQTVPALGRSYVLLQDPLSSDALAGLLAGAGFEYDNLGGSLTIYPDGTRAYAGSINTSYQGRHWVAGSWQTDSAFAVYADLALADPNYNDPAAVLQGGVLQLPLASVYGSGFADPQVVITNSDANMAAFGFPAGSTISGGVITLDTSSAFDGDVLVRAELRGVVVEDVIRLQVLQSTVGLSLASIEHLHAVSVAVMGEVPRVQPDSLAHSQSMAEPALVTLSQVSPAAVTHAQPVSLPAITQGSALSVIGMHHAQSLSMPTIDFDALLDPASVQHSQAASAVSQLGHRLQPASVQQAMQAAGLVIGNVPRVAPISVEHRVITSATGLDLRLVIVNLEHAQRVAGSDVRQTFQPLALANVEHSQSVAEVLGLFQANVLQPVTLEQLHLITNQTAVALSNTPLIPAGTLIIIR